MVTFPFMSLLSVLLRRRRLASSRSTCPTTLKIAACAGGEDLFVLEENHGGCEAAGRMDTRIPRGSRRENCCLLPILTT